MIQNASPHYDACSGMPRRIWALQIVWKEKGYNSDRLFQVFPLKELNIGI